MSHDRRHMSREEEQYYYNQRSQSQPGYYDDSQGNPYAYYSQPQPSPDYVRSSSYREQAVTRDRDRERYYSEDEDDVGHIHQMHSVACFYISSELIISCP